MDKEILVTVICLTYNHEKYIRECIDGFVMQKTNFAYEVIIHDDASTDNTAEIIKEYQQKYPDIIIPILQTENQYSKKVPIGKTFIYPRAKGKYIALCEGDDYWIDPYKLQKQVDILNEDNNYGLCYTKAKVYNQNKRQFENNLIGEKINGFDNLLIANKIPTLTTLYRKDLYYKYVNSIKPENKNWLMGDYPMWLWFSVNCKFVFLAEETAVYRQLENSASHFDNIEKHIAFTNSTRDIRLFFLEYLKKEHLIEVVNNSYYRENLSFAEYKKLRQESLKCLFKIKNKTKREKLKCLLYLTDFGFSYFNR